MLRPAEKRMNTVLTDCPSCRATETRIFHELRQVPAHSVLLLPTQAEARAYPRGDIALGFCSSCGFISNTAFDQRLNHYDGDYEATQGFSPTFNQFHRRLAGYLIDRYSLAGRTVVEIGCGQGEFLQLLSEAGGCKGIGFDPAFDPCRHELPDNPEVKIIRDYYSEHYADIHGDLFCCKMTLEHIPDVRAFVGSVARAVVGRPRTPVFFQVPNARYILRDTAFWDIYYEHCSYFTPGALARLFRACGFTVTDLWCDYGDQYVMVEARIDPTGAPGRLAAEEPVAEAARLVEQFAAAYPRRLEEWRGLVERIRREGLRAVVWGAGSKAVAFFSALQVRDEIPFAVDINPYKHETFMAGSGQEIVAPEFLRQYQPQLVIIMNPIYRDEIGRDLERLGVAAEIAQLS